MKLLNLKQTSCRDTDIVFRNSGFPSAVVAAISWACVGAAACDVIFGHVGKFEMPRWLAAIIGLFCLLFAWMTGKAWKASRRPTNWLLRIRGNDILIKFRSYQNWRMSEDDVQVIELHKDEIASVCSSAQRQISQSMNNGTNVERRVDLEIVLKNIDTMDLEQALAGEIKRPGWGGDSGRTKILDYPVQLADGGVIRIAWSNSSTRIRPRIDQALAELGKIAKVTEPEKSVGDFTPSGLKKLSEAEQQQKLAELARTNLLTAIETARKLYGCSLAEARQKIDALASKSAGD